MERQQLERDFCRKISMELQGFKQQMLRQKRKVIFDSSYKIEYIIRIYEILVELSQKLEEEQLEICLKIPGLLAFLYGEWLKIPDTKNEEETGTIQGLLERSQIQNVS